METSTVGFFQPALQAETKYGIAIPDDAFEEWVDECNGQRGSNQYWVELSALCNTTRNNGWNRRSKGQEEEELNQLVSVVFGQLSGAGKEIHAVGNLITDKEVGDG